ncbi:endo alpha-1,4 polygalactosaminidase [Sphingomonas sp. A2-49]|uniref:endo alpha-1,4 polygalactosaminidase n=1 Tax=Sphingomonas sp. A2-49 TaxID=1391375 RepID=UPI0021CE3C82|nr:endo alpha-1,4 polygalactosaminidase [Sphingomonas sp. A2-49]MCU6454548.1 endo alpha-1,4 polygalactosaminidase [Sphingomonas sp. A2-49]
MTDRANPERRRVLALGALGLALGVRAPLAAETRPSDADWRWAVDYGPSTDPALARACRLLVLEPHHPRPIAPLRGPGATLLGYVSLGEVERSRPYVATLDQAGALGPANPDWPDARMLDLRHPVARRLVVERIVPDVLALGYDGIFIDTIDSVEAMERRDPVANRGMIAAAATLIAELRSRFPRMRIMLNRGYALLPDAAPNIDILLGEAMASRWNFVAKRYDLLGDADWQWQADRLRAAQARNPALVLTTLDYWDPAATAQVMRLYAKERAAGFRPYVATLALDRLIPEPVA